MTRHRQESPLFFITESGENEQETTTEPKKKTEGDECKDNMDGCQGFKDEGYCEKADYIKQMQEFCCKTCSGNHTLSRYGTMLTMKPIL